MALVSDVLGDAPRALIAIFAAGGAAAVLLWWWIARRMWARVLGQAQRRHRLRRYALALVFSTSAALASVGALLLMAALIGYRESAERTRVAEVQCIERSATAGKLRMYYVPIERDGARGATRVFDLDGSECAITGELIRVRAGLRALLPSFQRVTRVAVRPAPPDKIDDGKTKPTSFDLRVEPSGLWRWLQARGEHGPLRWITDDLGGNTVSLPPDRRFVFDLWVAPAGYALQKHDAAGKAR